MKIIGQSWQRSVIVQLTDMEWDYLQRAAGVPMDKRRNEPGTEISIDPIKVTCEALWDMQQHRKQLIELQKRYDKLATAIDQSLPQ